MAESIPDRHEPSAAAADVRRAAPVEVPRPSAAPLTRFFQSLRDNAQPAAAANGVVSPAGARVAVPPAEAALARAIERESPPQVPPMSLQQFLAGRLGLRLPPVRIHVGPAADRLVSLFHADAVSFADRIAVRHRRYEPHTVAGAALLGHELTHVAAAAARAGPPSAAAAAREEYTALANEHRLLVDLAQTPYRTPSVPPPVPPAPNVTPVRAAAVDRPLPAAEPAGALERNQAARLKEEIFRELLDRIRNDFERGR